MCVCVNLRFTKQSARDPEDYSDLKIHAKKTNIQAQNILDYNKKKDDRCNIQ